MRMLKHILIRRFGWPGLLLFLVVSSADVVFRSVPEFDELASVTEAVSTHEVHDAKLRFRLEGVDYEFAVPATSTEQWYAILEAAEEQRTLTVWTWPAVLEGRGWPWVPYFQRVPWQIELEGQALLAYQERAAHSRSQNLPFLFTLLASASALSWWVVRARRPDAEPRSRESAPVDSEPENEAAPHSMPKAARWFWDLFGTLILFALVGLYVTDRSDRDAPIPTATDLVEMSGAVADVQVKTRKKHTDSSIYEIYGFSFALQGQQGRWEIQKTHWRYDLLARRLVPDASARFFVANEVWVAEHGEPWPTEHVWSVEVNGEQLISPGQATESARMRRERSDPGWVFGIVALAGLACFANGRLWGRGHRA